MRSFVVLINGEAAGTIQAPSYVAARQAARKAFRVSCDVIG